MKHFEISTIPSSGRKATIIKSVLTAVDSEARNKALAKVHAKSIVSFKGAVETLAKSDTVDIRNRVSEIEDAIDNLAVAGISAQYHSGVALAALRVHIEDSDMTWGKYCENQNRAKGGAFPSKAQANKRIRLASMAASMPTLDEAGNPWSMRTFEMWATTGSSMTSDQRVKLTHLRSQKGNKTRAIPLTEINRVDNDTVSLPTKTRAASVPSPSASKPTIPATLSIAGALDICRKAIDAATVEGLQDAACTAAEFVEFQTFVKVYGTDRLANLRAARAKEAAPKLKRKPKVSK